MCGWVAGDKEEHGAHKMYTHHTHTHMHTYQYTYYNTKTVARSIASEETTQRVINTPASVEMCLQSTQLTIMHTCTYKWLHKWSHRDSVTSLDIISNSLFC